LDEPFANLDIHSREEVFRMFLRLNQQANVTIVCVSHRNKIPQGVDKVVMIQRGRIIMDKTREIALKSEKFKAYCQLIGDI